MIRYEHNKSRRQHLAFTLTLFKTSFKAFTQYLTKSQQNTGS